MENQDKNTQDNQEQSELVQAPIRIHHTPNADEGDCIVLNADVHDEIEIDIEDAVVGQAVVIEPVSVVEKQNIDNLHDVEDAIIVSPQVAQVIEDAQIDDVVVTPDEVIDVVKVVEVVETAKAVEVAEVVEATDVVDVEMTDTVRVVEADTVQAVELVETATAITTEEMADVVVDMTDKAPQTTHEQVEIANEYIAIDIFDNKEPSRTVVNVDIVDTNVIDVIDIDMTDADDVKENVDVDTSHVSIDIDMTDDVGLDARVIDVHVSDVDGDDNQHNANVGYLHTQQSEPAVATAVASTTPYPPTPANDATTLDVSSDSIHKKHAFFPKNFTKPLLFLAGSSVLGIWVMQQSINAYFLQTYHKPSPLANIDNGIWKAGAKVHDGLAQIKQGTPTSPNESSSSDVTPKSAEPQTAMPPPVMTTEQTKEDIIKTSLTLNKTQKVFFAGDSLMQGVAPHVQKYLQEFGIKSVNLSKQSTGLAYPKFFDWPNTIKNTITKDKDIKVLVIMLGPNDPWDMPVKGSSQYLKFQSPEWDSEYQSRMADILNFTKENNVGVIWITPPNMKKQKLDTQMMYINDVMMTELARHNVQVVDARPVLGSIDNQYNDYVEQNGEKIKVRTGDGIHFTPNGQRILAQHIQSFLTIEP